MAIKHTYRESIIFAVIAALVSFLVVILAMWATTGQKRVVLSQKQELLKLTSDLSNLDKILSDEKSFEEVIKKVTATVPKEYSDIATAVSAVEFTAKTNNLSTELSIDQKPKTDTQNLRSLTMAIKTTGSYKDVSTFISSIAQLAYHTQIDSLVFDEAGSSVNGLVTIRLYIQ